MEVTSVELSQAFQEICREYNEQGKGETERVYQLVSEMSPHPVPDTSMAEYVIGGSWFVMGVLTMLEVMRRKEVQQSVSELERMVGA